jgi:amidase
VSVLEIMDAHLARIHEWNPDVNALVGLLPDEACREMARQADDRLARGEHPGPLVGLPIAFKDLHEAAGLVFTRGSAIYRDTIGVADSVLAARLRAAGALPIAKTNVPEFGLGSHTFNPVWGPTRNPYDLTRSAGGSSGGAGAALATGMLPIADGSDLGGSLRNPANFNNVVALRPTVGVVPTAPDPMPRLGFGVNGPMARSADDVALLFHAMAGPDPRDPGCQMPKPAGLDTALTGDIGPQCRVAWCPDLGGLPMEPAVRQVLDGQRATLVEMGCLVEDACLDLTDADEIFLTIRRWRTAAVHGPLLSRHRHEMKEDLVHEIEAGRRLTGEDVARAFLAHAALLGRVTAFFSEFDALACAVNQVAPFDVNLMWPREIDGVAMEHYIAWMKSTYWITTTFAPAVSVPAGFTSGGLPVGLQLVGRPWGDRRLLELAHRFEQANNAGTHRPRDLIQPVI